MKRLLIVLLIGIARGADWSYTGDHGVDHWDQISDAFCGGSRQSPINIPYADQAMEYSSDLEAFTLTGFDSIPSSGLEISNNGHSVVVSIKEGATSPVTVSGGGLNGTYIAAQFHFHWGQTDKQGSEHLFRNRQYPLELHIVNYKQAYGNLVDSLSHGDGLAVLGFFFVISDEDNAKLAPIISALDDIKYKGGKQNISINFDDVISGQTNEYYRYMGSLTTPTCNEAVVWTVFENKNFISSAQLAKFRGLYSTVAGADVEDKIFFNYRPIQKLYSRTVYKNYMSDVPSSFHWSYHGHQGPEYWKDYYHTCEGGQQSPVNIPSLDDVIYDEKLALDTLKLINYDKLLTGQIFNNGHTIQIDIDTDVYIQHGGLKGRYKAAQLHFHWGHDNKHGSEHLKNGKAFPLELHIVHYNERYHDIVGALNRPDGLAVVGFLFELGNTINSGYSHVISQLMDVKYKGQRKGIGRFTLEDLTYRNITRDHMPYYRYLGGLTTPPCLEIVTWNVMQVPVKIHADQVAEFRKMLHVVEAEAHSPVSDHDLIKENYRPTQALDHRRVYISTNPRWDIAGSSGLYQSMVTCFAIVFVGVLFR